MLQILTIVHETAERFDDKVNEALAAGWKLTQRGLIPGGFCAELEMEVITEAERCCENCRYAAQDGGEPCDSCHELNAWENP